MACPADSIAHFARRVTLPVPHLHVYAPRVQPLPPLRWQVVLFAVPGAFTTGCSTRHLPGYIARAAELSEKGVDRIACLSVNDVFVMDAWGREHGVADTFTMLADPDASFTTAVGMQIDASSFGLGLRSKRYAMVISDGVVTALLEEENGLSIVNSTAECVLAVL